MSREWKNHGTCSDKEIYELIKSMISVNFGYNYYIAFQTDKFLSGIKGDEALNKIEWNKLLEIRLFSEKSELLARRTMIGENNSFQWRIASEEEMGDDEYIIRYQTLDIDSNYTREGEQGNLSLLTTGGGAYELPSEEGDDSIKVLSYIDYSKDDGMAYIYDDRLVGFSKRGGGK